MNFVSAAFCLLFLIAYASRLTIGRQKTESPYLMGLLAASLVFYGWHIPAYVSIILVSTVVDYFAAILLAKSTVPSFRRGILAVSLVTNLGLLFFFKYTNFFIEQVNGLRAILGIDAEWQTLDLILPMGISFYTFQSMSYTIDVYRGGLQPLRSFWKFALFVSFFPQLVAGPIVRAKEFLYQIDRRRSVHLPVFLHGSFLVIRGFFLKLVIADNISLVVDEYWQQAALPEANSVFSLAVVTLFSFQIFCDFAGYSSIARGLAYLLGFRIPVNFRSPYIAGTFSGFWTRWHITLSAWLRDYLYIPLGGNRRGRLRTYANLMAVMLLGGLWHGAAVTFVAWGAMHGTALAVERALGMQQTGRLSAASKFGWYLVVQFTVLMTWAVFRAEDMGQATAIIGNVLRFRFSEWPDFPAVIAFSIAAPAIVMHLRTFLCERLLVPRPGPKELAVLAAIMVYACVTCFGVSSDFIYFQF